MAKHKSNRRPQVQKKPPLTHFLCLPLVTSTSRSQLEKSIHRFRDDIVARPPSKPTDDSEKRNVEVEPPATMVTKIHPKAIRPLGALHCTLGVMSLRSEQLQDAVNQLRALQAPDLHGIGSSRQADDQPGAEDLLPREPITVSLRGLESMHAPEKTSILYVAPSDSSERLRPLCLAIQDIFRSKGLLVPDDRPLRLHATIVNTIYAKGHARRPPRHAAGASSQEAGPSTVVAESRAQITPEREDRSQGHGPDANAPLKFDSRELLDKYKDFVWADGVNLDRIAICEMGARKRYDNEGRLIGEEYKEIASVELPTST